MLDLYVTLAWLIATIVVMIDLRSLRSELLRERDERIETEKRRELAELSRARVATHRHAEMMATLVAHIVPERPPTSVSAQQSGDGRDGPYTPREPAVARSQGPPAPPFDSE